MRSSHKTFFLFIVSFVALTVLGAQDSEKYAIFAAAKGEFVEMRLRLIDSTSLTRSYDFVLKSSRDSVRGRIRFPNDNARHPAALMCVGIETGKDVIELIEGHENLILMAVDYPFQGAMELGSWSAISTLLKLRTMGYRVVPLLLNCLDWLYEHPAVDAGDVSVCAVSFGTFSAVPAAVMELRLRRLIVVQGGSDLPEVLAATAHNWNSPAPSWLVKLLARMIFPDFEPNLYIADLAPRALVMVNSEKDMFFPIESARSMFDHAKEPKEMIFYNTPHVHPDQRALIKKLANIVAKKVYGE
jgi:hypothetical protein